MKKRNMIYRLLVAGCLLTSNNIFAQTMSNEILEKASDAVIYEIADLTIKADLSATKQEQIAEIIVQRNEEIKAMLTSGESFDAIFVKKKEYKDLLYQLLNTEEQYKIYVKGVKENAPYKYTYSQFAIGLRYKDSLNLTAAQNNSLMEQMGVLKAMKNEHYDNTQKSLDTRAYESEQISQILTFEQYNRLLYFKNIRKAENSARKDWAEVVQRSIDTDFNEAEQINILTNYYLSRAIAYNKYEHDVVMQKSEVNYLYRMRPNILRLLQRARYSPENDTLNGGFDGN